MKLTLIKYDNANALEATWTDEQDTMVKCHAYADVQMDTLRADALEMSTPLDAYESLIKEVENSVVLPTQEELDKALVIQKVQEYKAYLLATDFKMTVDYYATLSEVEQLELTAKRQEAREYIRVNEGVL